MEAPGFQLRVGSLHLEATSQPIALARAITALERQPELAAPAKLVLLGRDEAALMAEIPSVVSRTESEELALRALEEGWRWLDGASAACEADPSNGICCEHLEALLDEVRWRWQRLETGGYRVDAEGPDGSYRLRIGVLSDGDLHLSTSTTVGVSASEAMRAIRCFALESNRRLRLARLAVEGVEGERARAVWDAVLPGALPPELTLLDALEAVVGARAATARALAALCEPRVAETYLRLREGESLTRPAPRRCDQAPDRLRRQPGGPQDADSQHHARAPQPEGHQLGGHAASAPR